MKNKKTVIIILFFCISSCIYAQIIPILPIENQILENISTEKIYKNDINPAASDLDYENEISSKIETFISSLNKLNVNSVLEGNWILVDSEFRNNILKNSYHNANSFAITSANNFLEYKYSYYVSNIYSDEENLYFFPSVHSWIIKRIVLSDEKLYLYILENGEWVLDPIHDGGKYFYVKEKK